MVTDSICDHFFTTSALASEFLRNIGMKEDRIHFVGNTMIDTLYQNLNRLKQPHIWSQNNLKKGNYFLLTLHRPSNVDDILSLRKLLDVILDNTGESLVIFPVHPRTQKIFNAMGYNNTRLIPIAPLGYLDLYIL